MCTIDPPRAARAQASYRAALDDTPHEFVVIDSPSSLAAGYAEGLRRANGDIVVFSHDDVEVLIEGFAERLRAHLARTDIVGVAGATDVRGPAWAHAGHPYLHGAVGYATHRGFEAHVYSTQGPLVAGARVLDGVLLATRREVAARVGWDAVAFDGFHGYDIDFCLRAGAQGHRLGVACDLGVLHRSQGEFDARWETYARKLMRRHAALNQPVSERTFAFARRCASRVELAAYFAGLRAALDALAPLDASDGGTSSV
jgi:GT2 family glycosyltransferase